MWIWGNKSREGSGKLGKVKTYAGIGSRITPSDICQKMENIATDLERLGYVLSTGCAEGADRAFLGGVRDGSRARVFIPEESRRESLQGLSCEVICPQTILSAEDYGKMEVLAAKTFEYNRGCRWESLKSFVRALHTRNMAQVLGLSLVDPVAFLLCWTPDGAETETSKETGGTGQAIRCAIANGIPVINLATSDWRARLINLLKISNFQMITGDLWDYIGVADAVCITTNGFVKQRDQVISEAVMGKGCAAQALKRYPAINLILGHAISRFGNVPRSLCTDRETHIVSFPVKPKSLTCTSPTQIVAHQRFSFGVGSMVPGWACMADLTIIQESATTLVKLASENNWKSVVLPRPGCGAGELSWEDVCPLLRTVPGFDSRFSVITYRN